MSVAAPVKALSRYLSHSRVNRYLLCPEQYRLYYVEGLRPRRTPSNLIFGTVVHRALAGLLADGEDPVALFQHTWRQVETVDLSYGRYDSWQRLSDIGEQLLERFVSEAMPRITNVCAVEQRFELTITSLDSPLVGYVDLVADFEGRSTVIDFKTASSSYRDHEVVMSDQLTAYQLSQPNVDQLALCVLVKTKQPKIAWQTGNRSPHQLSAYLVKLTLVGQGIARRQFYQRPGMWCSWCDFLPVCAGDTKKADETLIHVSETIDPLPRQGP